jgi:hypothetical protein
MYARPPGKNNPYFCCELDQIGVVPNLCFGNNITVDTAQLASKVLLESCLKKAEGVDV